MEGSRPRILSLGPIAGLGIFLPSWGGAGRTGRVGLGDTPTERESGSKREKAKTECGRKRDTSGRKRDRLKPPRLR
jgi:hypothetical protein